MSFWTSAGSKNQKQPLGTVRWILLTEVYKTQTKAICRTWSGSLLRRVYEALNFQPKQGMLTKHQPKTPLKTNMERENHLFERNIIFQTFILGFHVGVLVFWRVGDMYMLPPRNAYLFTLRETTRNDTWKWINFIGWFHWNLFHSTHEAFDPFHSVNRDIP